MYPRNEFSGPTRGALIAIGIIAYTTECLVLHDLHDRGMAAFDYFWISGPLVVLVIVIAFFASPTFQRWRVRRARRRLFGR